MTSERLPAAVEVTGLLRRVQAAGDFGTIIHKGDPDRGAILLLVTSRGRHVACFERMLGFGGDYVWQPVGPGESESSGAVAEFVAKRTRFDEDMWAIELDIAEPERFIAETTAAG